MASLVPIISFAPGRLLRNMRSYVEGRNDPESMMMFYTPES
jgi:hypothetical protein